MNRPGRIIQLRISGMRVIEDLTLDLGGLTVLIGDNGTGKSTILEALELLRLASHPMSFVRDVISSRHGGIDALLRRGAEQLSLGCRLRSAEGILIDYGFTLAPGCPASSRRLQSYLGMGRTWQCLSRGEESQRRGVAARRRSRAPRHGARREKLSSACSSPWRSRAGDRIRQRSG